MGSNQSSSAKAILNDSNQLYETSSTACIANCTALQINPTIVISNTTVGGNVDITNQCNASASCVMQSTLDGQVQNIMSSMTQQENVTTQLLPIAFDFNNKNTSVQIKQNITNNITQTMQAVCQATSNTIQTNPTIVGSNATVGGNLSITGGGSANASCTITNLARMNLFNQSTSTNNQTTKQASVLGIMMIAIVLIMVIGAIILVIIIGPAGLAAVVGMESSGKKSSEGDGESGELASLLGSSSSEGGEGAGMMSKLESAALEGGEAI